MGTVGVVLLVAFVIVCALLVLLVLVQDDGSHGMGGLLGGRGTAAFGSHSASVLTRTTFTLVVLFFALALSLALLNRKSSVRRDLAPAAGVEAGNATESKKWYDEVPADERAATDEEAPVAGEEESEAAAMGSEGTLSLRGSEATEATSTGSEATSAAESEPVAVQSESAAANAENESAITANSGATFAGGGEATFASETEAVSADEGGGNQPYEGGE